MSLILQHIGIHLIVLAVITTLISYFFSRTIEAHSKAYLIPFYGFIKAIKRSKLPWWFSILILQCYWLPLNWVHFIAIAIFFLWIYRWASFFAGTEGLNKLIIGFGLFLSFYSLLHPVYQGYTGLFINGLFELDMIALIAGLLLLSRLKKEKFLKKKYHSKEFNFTKYALQQFHKNIPARIGLYILGGLVMIGFYADFLANSTPIFVEQEGKLHTPVYTQLIDPTPSFELDGKDVPYGQIRWRKLSKEKSYFALIPYSPTDNDKYNRNFASPRGKQRDKLGEGKFVEMDGRFRHHLGTDQIGRDVAAGLVHATRISLTVGLISMGIAALIGIVLGALAGFFGNDRLLAPRITYLMIILGLVMGYFYAFVTMEFAAENARNEGGSILLVYLIKGLLLFGLPVMFAYLSKLFMGIKFLAKPILIPLDRIVMRAIEVLNSIPRLLLIITIAATFEEKSLVLIMIVIGLTSWTGIARFTRAEFLRIRELNYMEATRALGYSNRRAIFKHATPNALAPVFVSIAFGIASAILIESSLSFLGIGVPEETVTWGSLLNEYRQNDEAWWLIVFPGLAIFVTITIYNLIGEGLRDALDPKLKK